MKNVALFFFLFSLLQSVLTTGCCLGQECTTDDNFGYFRIVDAATGADLVFGPSPRYQKNDILFYSKEGLDSIPHFYFPTAGPGNDSLFFVRFLDSKNTVLLRLNNNDADTLQVTYRIKESTCCPDYEALQTITYKGAPVPQLNGSYFIRK